MTQEEASREAKRRWGTTGWAAFFPVAKMYGKPPYEVGSGDVAPYHGLGASFEEAFKNSERLDCLKIRDEEQKDMLEADKEPRL